MLDLGVWMSIQSVMERIHRTLIMKNDQLAVSINTAFDVSDSKVLKNVYNRWKLVLDLIIKGEGGNQLVERCRNKGDKVEDLVYVDELNRDMKLVDIAAQEETSDEESSDEKEMDWDCLLSPGEENKDQGDVEDFVIL